MFAPYRFESGALRRKTSAGFASGQGFFLGNADDAGFVDVFAGETDVGPAGLGNCSLYRAVP